jgi:hypothetical protein
VLPCVPYDKLADIDQGAAIEHKRLGHALQVAQALNHDEAVLIVSHIGGLVRFLKTIEAKTQAGQP